MKNNFIILIILLFFTMPSSIFAEVSDKMPTIPHIIIISIVISTFLFILCWLRWWFIFFSFPIFILFVIGTISLWNEMGMREALLIEQGWYYFGALGFQNLIIGISIFLGAFIGYNRQKKYQLLL